MNMENKEKRLAEIRELLEDGSWKDVGIYKVLQILEDAGLTEGVSAELQKIVEAGALYRWFQAYNRKKCGAYENNPEFVEARILEYCVNEAEISPEKAEELIAYVRVMGKTLTKETITNMEPAEPKAEEIKDESAKPKAEENKDEPVEEEKVKEHRNSPKQKKADSWEKPTICVLLKTADREWQKKAVLLTGACGVLLAGCAVCMLLFGRKK